MPFTKAALVCAAALSCANSLAAAPSYDGRTPMIETGPVWFDPALSPDEQLSIARLLVQADAHIAAVYGQRLAPIRLVWCKTAECTTFFAGTDRRPFSTGGRSKPRKGAQYKFTFPAVVVLGVPRPFTGGVLKHEMSHMEFRARLRGASVPSWFNEGVATWVGGEHDGFCQPGMKGVADLFELDARGAWLDYTNTHRDKSRPTYCQARNEVDEWITGHGGFGAVLDLLTQRAKGQTFWSLYGGEHERPAASAASGTTRDDDETND